MTKKVVSEWLKQAEESAAKWEKRRVEVESNLQSNPQDRDSEVLKSYVIFILSDLTGIIDNLKFMLKREFD